MRLQGFFVLPTLLATVGLSALAQHRDGLAQIPRTWDDGEIATHKVPLADAAASPKEVTGRLLLPNPGPADLQGLSRVRACARAGGLPRVAEAAGARHRLG